MIKYNWQQKDWPYFNFSLKSVEGDLLYFSEKAGRVSGIPDTLPDDTKQ